MKSMVYFLRGILFIVIGCTAASIVRAQPRGWPCDYGYRPGNAWFYRSALFNGQVYCQSVLRDSIGADGAYWVFVKDYMPGYWYRIDSTCGFDRFFDPPDERVQRWLASRADSGDTWLVDTIGRYAPLHARVDAFNHRNIFGKAVTSKNIVYYKIEVGEIWHRSEEWVEGFGMIESWEIVQGHDELIGAIIDGVHYGNTSGVDDRTVESADRVGVYPCPASSTAMLSIATGSEHIAMVGIHDLLGRFIRKEQVRPSTDNITITPLDVSDLAPGRYLVSVVIGDSRYTTVLVVAR